MPLSASSTQEHIHGDTAEPGHTAKAKSGTSLAFLKYRRAKKSKKPSTSSDVHSIASTPGEDDDLRPMLDDFPMPPGWSYGSYTSSSSLTESSPPPTVGVSVAPSNPPSRPGSVHHAAASGAASIKNGEVGTLASTAEEAADTKSRKVKSSSLWRSKRRDSTSFA